MITTDNYKEWIEKIGVENLSANWKEFHETLKSETKNFKDWSQYNNDKDIRLVTDHYFKMLEKMVPEVTEKTEKSKVKASRSVYDFKVTPENYFSVVSRLDLPKEFAEDHQYIVDITVHGVDWNDYANPTFKKKADAYFKKLAAFIKTIPAVIDLKDTSDYDEIDIHQLARLYDESIEFEVEHSPTIDGIVYRQMLDNISKERSGREITDYLEKENPYITLAKSQAKDYKKLSIKELEEKLNEKLEIEKEYGVETINEIHLAALRQEIYSRKGSEKKEKVKELKSQTIPVSNAKAKFHIGQSVIIKDTGSEGVITNVLVRKKGRFIPGQGAEEPVVSYSYAVQTNGSIETFEEDEITLMPQGKTVSNAIKEAKKVIHKKVLKAREKKVREKIPRIKAKGVAHLTEDRKLIKRLVQMHDKEKSKGQILKFIQALQRAIIQKLVNKKSKFVNEIRAIQEAMVKYYNTMSAKETFEIPQNKLARFVAIAGGEAVFKSIGIMKTYVGMKGHQPDEVKADSFIGRIERMLSKGIIGKDDPYLRKVKEILKEVKDYKINKLPIAISKEELSGLEGILNACGCSHEFGTIYETRGKTLRKCRKKTYSDAGKGACSHNRGLAGTGEAMTAEEIVNMQFELLPFPGIWKDLFGQPEKNFSMMFHGEPGAGKSTFLVKFAKYLSTLGSVLYVTSEEYGSVTLKNLVSQHLNPFPGNILFVPNLDATNPGDFDFVIFDSVTDAGIKLEDFKSMKAENPNTGFLLVLQHTKDGQFKGGKEWEHEAQIVGKISNGTVDIYKNRYGEKSSWYFFDN
jgi:hypothetical protein